MAKRKSKKQQEEDASVLLESPVQQSRRNIKSYASPSLLLIITLITGACVMGWFCVQQQKTLDQLSESFTAMQRRISHVQQVIDMTDSQMDTSLVLEERIVALEEAQKQAQAEQKAQVSLATSEKLKNTELHSQLLALHAEMDTRLAEIKQVALSIATLQAMMKDQNEEFEAMKENIVAGLHSSSALAADVAGLTSAVDDVGSRADKQVASMDALNAELQAQAHGLKDLKESQYLHNEAIHTNIQEMAAIKDFVEAKHAMCAQALEEILNSLQMALDEQVFSSKSLLSSVMAQLHTFNSKLAPIEFNPNEEGPAAEESKQHATEVEKELEDDEEEAAQEDAEERAEEEVMEDLTEEDEEITGWSEEQEDVEEQAEEEDLTGVEEEITGHHEEQGDVEQAEEEVMEDVTEEEEEITGEHMEQEDAGDTAEEEGTAESVEDDKTLEDEVSEDVAERETMEEMLAELNSDAVLDEDVE